MLMLQAVCFWQSESLLPSFADWEEKVAYWLGGKSEPAETGSKAART
jgi:hypothetical protein